MVIQMDTHANKVERLQKSIRDRMHENGKMTPLSLSYRTGHSNTTRTKAYKLHSPAIDLSHFNEIIRIDPEKKTAIVEPRVTMEALLRATLAHRLIPAILPEFKNITVGGAIMGGGAESSSHTWGCFNDICNSYEIINGQGDLLIVSPHQNSDLYYGIAGSYGSLGALVSAEIQLIPAQNFVYLHYHFFSDPLEALEMMKNLVHSHKQNFIDGMIFDKNLAVVIEGSLQPKEDLNTIPLFSLQSRFSPWYYQHVKQLSQASVQVYSEKMSLEDYLFRYDLGAFWMGTYVFKFSFLIRFLSQGIMKLQNRECFTKNEIQRFHKIQNPSILGRGLCRPLLNAQNLWKLLHKAESWIQKRIVIQDFCIPESHSVSFCKDILNQTAIFPIWLCPIKGTKTPQIFMPHILNQNQTDTHFINFGLYGIPNDSMSIQLITKKLEESARDYGGRKTLYSHSYYTQDEFWKIYDHDRYANLRNKNHAQGMWHEITDKVLSD